MSSGKSATNIDEYPSIKKSLDTTSGDFYCSKHRKRYGGMHDTEVDLSKRMPISFSFKTVNGMEACATFSRDTILTVFGQKFQNRKRYGGMRDASTQSPSVRKAKSRFKTVNGMEACATAMGMHLCRTVQILFQNRKRYGGMRDLNRRETCSSREKFMFQNRKRYGGMRDQRKKRDGRLLRSRCFKTVNGMEACATSFY